MLLQHGNIVLLDGSVLEKTDLRIAGSVISEIKRGLTPHKDETRFDIDRRWVLPGLINAHVHIALSGTETQERILNQSVADFAINGVKNAETLLMSGFTTVRDLGAPHHIDISVKHAIESGRLNGPRIMVSGKPITTIGGHAWYWPSRQADGREECRKAAREELFAGADQLKVMATGGLLTMEGDPGAPQLTEEEIGVIVEVARDAGKKVAAHCHGLEGIRRAVHAGVDSIEHGSYADEEALVNMRERGIFLCTCLRATFVLQQMEGASNSFCDCVRKRAAKAFSRQCETYTMAHELGVKLAYGTDSGTPLNPHKESSREFGFMARCGLSPVETIHAATKYAAELLGIDNAVGTLEIGKIADILVIEENPLDSICVLENLQKHIILLFKAGQTVIEK